MKKLLAILIGTVLVASAGLAVASTARAEITVDSQTTEEPQVCCQLKHSIDLGGGRSHSTGECPYKPGSETLCTTQIPGCTNPKEDSGWGGFCLMDSILTITDWIKWLAMVIIVAAILAAGIMFITAGGSTERVSTAKKMLLYSIVGVAIALLAHLIPSVIKFFL